MKNETQCPERASDGIVVPYAIVRGNVVRMLRHSASIKGQDLHAPNAIHHDAFIHYGRDDGSLARTVPMWCCSTTGATSCAIKLGLQ